MSWLLLSVPAMVAGLIFLARVINPPGGDLAEVFSNYEVTPSSNSDFQHEVNSTLGAKAIALVHFFEQDRVSRLLADLELVGEDLEQHALERLGLAVFGGPILSIFTYLTGLASALWILAVLGLVGAIVGYLLPGQQVSSKARLQRIEFDVALRDVISLLVASTRGGGGLNSAVQDAVSVCTSPSMDTVKQDLWNRMLGGDQAAEILLDTGVRLQIESLVSLGQSLSIASSSGSSVDATLVSRGKVAAESETMRRLRDAEEEGERMTIFIGVIASGLTAFILYPSLIALFSLAS